MKLICANANKLLRHYNFTDQKCRNSIIIYAANSSHLKIASVCTLSICRVSTHCVVALMRVKNAFPWPKQLKGKQVSLEKKNQLGTKFSESGQNQAEVFPGDWRRKLSPGRGSRWVCRSQPTSGNSLLSYLWPSLILKVLGNRRLE